MNPLFVFSQARVAESLGAARLGQAVRRGDHLEVKQIPVGYCLDHPTVELAGFLFQLFLP